MMPPPISMRICAVVWPLVTATILPLSRLRALSHAVFGRRRRIAPGIAAPLALTFLEGTHPPIPCPIAILAKSTNLDAAKFLDYLKSPPATRIFK